MKQIIPAVDRVAITVSPLLKVKAARISADLCTAIAIPSTQSPPNNDLQNRVVGMSVVTTRVNNPAVLHETAAISTSRIPTPFDLDIFIS